MHLAEIRAGFGGRAAGREEFPGKSGKPERGAIGSSAGLEVLAAPFALVGEGRQRVRNGDGLMAGFRR